MSTASWWMYHGDQAHSGEVVGSRINSQSAALLELVADIPVGGPVLSVPALVGGMIYVGIANTSGTPGVNGGSFYKYAVATGEEQARFDWVVAPNQGDSHGFQGMGCTPAVIDGAIFFSAFDGKLYCLDQATLQQRWVTDLRHQDPAQNQPVNNVSGDSDYVDFPNAAGWSSPVVANGRVYVGMGEGENPKLFGFVYCLDAFTGSVIWIYCTCLFDGLAYNQPNVLPAGTVSGTPPAGYTTLPDPAIRGCSVWSSIAYDATLDRLFLTTGNPNPDSALPSHGLSNGILSLDAQTGNYCGFFQASPESSYRPSDNDVDFGGSAMLFDHPTGVRAVAAGCKNGTLFVLDAGTMVLIDQRQLLPVYNDGSQIATVDPHIAADDTRLNPYVSNEESNATPQENFYGTYSTPAVSSTEELLFIGIGGNNYHNVAAGIDCTTTPFMRALKMTDLTDAWPVDGGNPPLYVNAAPPMFANPGEAALSSPLVVNDVVFCSTNFVGLYAFAVADGTTLWGTTLGAQTGGLNGGYGYCLGPAIEGDYLVAGALVSGGNGGVLRVFSLPSRSQS